MAASGAAGLLSLLAPATSAAATLQCDVAIVGGGPGGVHTAYQLATKHLTAGPICLFEMEDHLGGRVGDNVKVGFSGKAFKNQGVKVKNSGETGTGGYRMYGNQYTYALGQQLAALGKPGQLTFLEQNSFSQLTEVENPGLNPAYNKARYFSYTTSDAGQLAPLYNSPVNDNDLWTAMLCGPQVPVDEHNVPQYRQMAIPGLGTMSTAEYLEWVTANVISPQNGPEVAQYMRDTWRFRSDFTEPNDTVGYLEFTAKDFTGGPVIYPIPSFQPYFEIMAGETTKNGGKIYMEEKVLSVETRATGPRYALTTTRHNVRANKVILAVPREALHVSAPGAPPGGITGNVIDQITSQAPFNGSASTISITITHQFGDGVTPNSGWWHGDISYPNNGKLLGPQLGPGDSPLRRSINDFSINGDVLPCCHHAGCDFTDVGFSTNVNELPLTDYHDFINVSRSVYQDRRDAVNNWIALYEAGEALSPGGGNAAVNKQILKSFRRMYPKVFTGNPLTEPPILDTFVEVHDPAWYNLRQGAQGAGITSDILFAWSLHPLANEQVYMVGDAWRTDESGWSDAAYKGSIYVLDTYFGANIDPMEGGTIGCVDGQIGNPT
ncbi:MAG: FAD/NAD(P)-binding protein [Byssovorax sp.]